MPGAPKLGRKVFDQARTSSAEELLETPQPKVLGDIDTNVLLAKEDLPPPWEADPKYLKHNTDARRFVDVPDKWELRWLNPRLIEANGLRDWEPVKSTDPKVKVKNRALITPEYYIRRGGQGGDLLCWMPRSWVISRNRLKLERAAKMAASAVARQEQTVEEIQRGHFGPHTHVDSYRHPTHTVGDGRTMQD